MQKELVWRNLVILSVSLVIFFMITLFVTNYINRHNQEQEVLYLSRIVERELMSADDLSDVVYDLTEDQTRYYIVLADNDGVILIDGASDQMGEGLQTKLTDTELSYYPLLITDSYVYSLDGYMHCLSRFNGDFVLRTSVATTDNTEFIIVSAFFLAVMLLIVVVISIIMTTRTSKKITQSFNKVNYHLKTIAGGQYEEILTTNTYPEVAHAYSEMNAVIGNIVKYIESINNEKDKLNSIINNIGEGIIILNSAGDIITINDFAMDFIDNHSCVGVNYAQAIGNTVFAQTVADGLGGQDHLDYYADDGKIYFVSFNKYLEKSTGNSFVAIVLFDVTAARMEEKSRAEFIANASHELKTPITSISGFSELLASGMITDQETISKYANMIFNSSLDMKNTVDELLYLSKIDYSNKQTLATDVISLKELIYACVENYRMNAERRNVSISVECEDSAVIGNFGLLAHMCGNLIDNAIKYNVDGGSVIVSGGVNEDGKPFVSVKDTGIGIDKRHLGRLYERFYRVDDSRSRNSGGTGLGLTIVEKIVSIHNAEIHVDSVVGEGSEFVVVFPTIYKNGDSSKDEKE